MGKKITHTDDVRKPRDPQSGLKLRSVTVEYEGNNGEIFTKKFEQTDGKPINIEVSDGEFYRIPNPKRYVNFTYNRDVQHIYQNGPDKPPTLALPTGASYITIEIAAGCDFQNIRPPYEEKDEEEKPATE